MATNKKTLLTLLLDTSLIPVGKPPVSLLEIIKKDKSIDFKVKALSGDLISKNFYNYPLIFKNTLLKCIPEALEEKRRELLERYERLKIRTEYDEYFTKEIILYWHQIFESLKPFFPMIKWYFKKEQPGKKNSLTAPCSFSTLKPVLSFEVVKENEALRLEVNIALAGSNYPLKTFTRSTFFLRDKNEFFVLSYKDYTTLGRIALLDVSKYEHQPYEFAKHILADLEGEYPVNRNNCISAIEIDTAPVCRVLLTELNNSFLMLTPQWIYDGFVIDGSFNVETELVRSGIIYSVKRHKEAEEEFVKKLVRLHKNFNSQHNGFFYLTFADAIKGQWFFKVYQQFLKLNIEFAGMDMLAHFRYSPHIPETKMVIKEEDRDIITFEMEISFGGETIPLNELQKILLAGQKAVMLKDGSLGMLGESWLNQYASIIRHSKIISKKEIEILRWMAVTEQENTNDNPTLREVLKKEWRLKWNQWQSGSSEIYSLSSRLNASLRPYQVKGYEWLLLLQEIGAGACLADDMGLGKTIQAISSIIYFTDKYPQSKNIIICPASLIYTWQQEFEKFAPSIKTVVYHGAARQQEQLSDPDINIVITTYTTMRNDVELLTMQSYGIAVLDESHNIKNPATQIAQAVMRIKARFRIALSGTPVINNTFDLYSQLQFVVPGLFGSREFFKNQYANPIDNFQDEEKIAALRKLTAPFILRRTKEQVAKDLPEKTETILWCTMGSSQKNVYQEILESSRSSIFLEIKNNGLAKSKLSILQAMTRLRQVCSSPALLPPGEHKHCTESVKLTTLMDELNNILEKHKVIVFSQFTSMLHLLADECRKQSIAFYHFDGQTPPAKRAEMVQSFQQETNKVNLFLISLKAGNTGLTLTAADYVFLFDPWWNNAIQDQAIDRTHRIGQTKNVFAYKMICKNTIEEKIISLQQKKKKLSEDLVSADNNFVKSLTEEDVEYLFS